MTDNNIDCVKRFLKNRLQFDFISLHGYESERLNVQKVLQRTIEYGESNSLLIVGPRSCGKTTLMNAVLVDLLEFPDFIENTLIVHLNGIVHTDDRAALRSITVQLNLETMVDGKVFTSFAENLAFLLDSLRSGGGKNNNKSKSVIFILEEFDLFCTHHNQTLLYNLFDVAQSAQAPISVVGITCRLDVIELLEKRVKSRFSHRQVFLLPKVDAFQDYVALCGLLLSVPVENQENDDNNKRIMNLNLLKSNELAYKFNNFDAKKYQISKNYARTWNEHIAKLLTNNVVKNALKTFFNYDVNEAFMKKIIYKMLSQLNPATQPFISPDQFEHFAEMCGIDDKVNHLVGLSVLELCIVIAIKHHTEIYDRDPFNFEIVFARFMKFSKYSNTMKNIERSIAVRAFEHLCNIEFILPLTAHSEKHQKDFAMHRLTLTSGQIDEAIQKYQGLPTEISQWSQTGLIQS